MKRRWRWLAWLPIASFVFALPACESERLTGPRLAPQASLGGGLTPVVSPGPLQQDEKVIGPLGGMLSIGYVMASN